MSKSNKYLFRIRELAEDYTRQGGRGEDLDFGNMGVGRGRG